MYFYLKCQKTCRIAFGQGSDGYLVFCREMRGLMHLGGHYAAPTSSAALPLSPLWSVRITWFNRSPLTKGPGCFRGLARYLPPKELQNGTRRHKIDYFRIRLQVENPLFVPFSWNPYISRAGITTVSSFSEAKFDPALSRFRLYYHL